MTDAQRTGYRGEQLAAREYRNRGYKICGSNFRIALGEIDLIASDDTYLRFVEVKTRAPSTMLPPREAVTEEKQHRIVTAARAYIKAASLQDMPVRFDIAEVILYDMRHADISIIEDAFFDDSFRREPKRQEKKNYFQWCKRKKAQRK